MRWQRVFTYGVRLQPSRSQEEIPVAKQAQLAENLAKAEPRSGLPPRQNHFVPPTTPVTPESHILETSDDLLRVSAGLRSVLTLLVIALTFLAIRLSSLRSAHELALIARQRRASKPVS
ncbi:DUF1484 family protein [Cupriavidus taiwanensis]|uniref:DUF1484 family protein n=1 Tax=Cupriavidus taiwanensis TaxID=164546 RepID=UPI000E2F2065|nr:DUF1484 family protein [Cupriavidus taiwanensis]